MLPPFDIPNHFFPLSTNYPQEYVTYISKSWTGTWVVVVKMYKANPLQRIFREKVFIQKDIQRSTQNPSNSNTYGVCGKEYFICLKSIHSTPFSQ